MHQEPSMEKCRGCSHRTCMMEVDEVIATAFQKPKAKHKLLHRLYEKAPDGIFLRAINIHRGLKGKPKVRYSRIADGFRFDYGDFVLEAPTGKWINSSMGRFEQKLEVFHRIQPGDICVDIGSCIGDTTLPMVVRAGPKGRVIAVEPMPANLRYLSRNLAKYPNASIIAKAVSDSKGTQDFFTSSAPTGHSLQENPSERDAGTIKVECDTLNDMFDGQKIDFCKIDVQGYETVILKGQDRFFDSVGYLLVETHDRYDPGRATYPEVLSYLKQKPFDIRFCIHDGIAHCQKRNAP